jgi:type I restriction enzyme S subunit
MKPGYKRTALGLIPGEWNVLPLADLCRSITDGTHFTPRYVQQGIPFYSVENITADDFTNTKFISSGEHAILVRRCKPERGDILMTRITAGVLGDTRLIDWDVNASIYVSLALLKPNDQVVAEYLYCYSKSPAFRGDVEKRALLNATPKKINMGDIASVPIPVPRSREEQRLIAAALSDVDALLAGLDRLIAKKRDLKQAAMQQLLTGQTRLPGFSGAWEEKKIGEFAECTAGGTPNTGISSYWGGAIRWMSSGELNLKRVDDVEGRITKDGLENSSASMLPVNCILIGLAGQGKTRGTVAMNFVELCTNQSIAAVLPSPTFVPEYLYYNLDSRYDELRELSTGGGGRGGLNLTIIKSVIVPFPTYAEQQAIATTLSDIDAEITALESRREKTHAIKQAMMQELLTGNIRLVTPEASHA